MSNFFRRLRAAFLFSQVHTYKDLPDDFWTKEDALAWLKYRTSPSGTKLGFIINNMVMQRAVFAVRARSDRDYENGWASGVAAFAAELESYFPAQLGANSEQSEEQPQGAAEPFEQLAP